MIVLGLDTCLASCSVAVLDGERVLASAREVMARGHQERLAPMARRGDGRGGPGLRPPGPHRRHRRTRAPSPACGSASPSPRAWRFALGTARRRASARWRPWPPRLHGPGRSRPSTPGAASSTCRPSRTARALMAPDALTAEVAAARLAELSQGRPFTLVGSGAALLADFAPSATVDRGRRRRRAPCGAPGRRPRAGAAEAALSARARRQAAGAGRHEADPRHRRRMRRHGRAHAQAFAAKAWREDEFEDLLEGEGIYRLPGRATTQPLGVILCRVAAGEVEVLTVGVTPAARRRGVAQALMLAALDAGARGRRRRGLPGGGGGQRRRHRPLRTAWVSARPACASPTTTAAPPGSSTPW